MMKLIPILVPLMLIGGDLTAQYDDLVLSGDNYPIGDAGADPSPDLVAYDALIKAHGTGTIRSCDGFPCSGWVEDHYPAGGLKHRGYYDQGQLITFRNYHPNGALEREFKVKGSSKSTMNTFHANGQLRSVTSYMKGEVVAYEDHYVNGVLRYREDRHPRDPYYTRMDLFDGQGRPISLFQLVDARNEVFELKEFHPGGALKCEGRARYDRRRMDTQRIGIWQVYAPDGALIREDRYLDGKVHQ